MLACLIRITLALVVAFIAPARPALAREIALSFDDAPMPASALMTGDARAEAIIAGLRRARAPRVVFFANPGRDTPGGMARLARYARAGHLIANHTATHPNLDEVSAETFLADAGRANSELRGLRNYRPWFRFPYLNEGATEAKRDAVRTGLKRLRLKAGYVTVNTWDWRLAALLNEALVQDRHPDMEAMGALYVETMVGAADFYDDLARRYLGASPRHVMLLHENDLAALYSDDLVAALRADGWTVISPERAYRDRIATRDPDTIWLNQGRVAALARIAGARYEETVGPRENHDVLIGLFNARVLHAGR